MKRLDKIKQTYQDRLASHIKDNGMDISVDMMFDTIVYNDPSQDKRYTRWLVETYLNDGYLFEDISAGEHSKVTETLRVFMKHSRKLNPVDRSINRYESIADMWKMVKQYAEDKTGHQVKRDEHDRAMAESEIVIDNDDIRIVVPLTEYASKFHGRGTRWCTAADNHNMFWGYAKEAPLFIIMNRHDGKKFQIWKHNGNVQFMDEDDANISYSYIEKTWNILNPIFHWLDDIRYIRKDLRTKAMCEKVVVRNGQMLIFVPDHLREDKEWFRTMCFHAVKTSALCLKGIPEEFKTPDLYMVVCQNNTNGLMVVPEYMRTRELCDVAIARDANMFGFVPDYLKTKAMFEDCVSRVPKNIMHSEIFMSEYTDAIEEIRGMDIPDIEKNRMQRELWYSDICRNVVNNNGSCIRHIPKRVLMEQFPEPHYGSYAHDMVKSVFKETPNSIWLRYIPDELKTKDFFSFLVSKNGGLIQHVPDDMLNDDDIEWRHDLYVSAIKNAKWHDTKYILDKIPECERTKEIFEMLVNNNESMIQHIPLSFREDKEWYYDICLNACEQDGLVLLYVPDELKTIDMCKKALISSPHVLEYIPENIQKTEDMQNLILELKNNEKHNHRPNKISEQITGEILNDTYMPMIDSMKKSFM